MVSAEAKQDAEVIRQIISSEKGDTGLDEILKLLCHHSKGARQQIKRAYRSLYREEMQDNIAKAYKGSDDVLNALLHLPEDYDAKELYNAMKGLGTTEATLTEILCTRNNDEIRNAAYSFRHWFGVSLKDTVAGDTSGDYRSLMLGLVQANRDEKGGDDISKATGIAQSLSDKKVEKENFVQVLTTEGYPALKVVGDHYGHITGKPFEEGLKKQFGGDAESAATAILKAGRNKADYFSELIHDSVKKGSVDVVLRICGSREGKDLHLIREEFLKKYNIPLDNYVEDYIKDKKASRAKDVVLHLIRSA